MANKGYVLYDDNGDIVAPPTKTYNFEVDTGGTLKTDLLAFWKLDEYSGDRVDLQGNFNMTADTAVAGGGVGRRGPCAVFNGVNGKDLSHADSALFPSGHDDFTISLWINFRIAGNNDYIISKWVAGTASFTLNKFTDNEFYWYVYHDGTNQSNVNDTIVGAISADTWYHVIIYHDGVNDLIGLKINGNATETTAHNTGMYDSGEDFQIGNYGGADGVVDGRMCDVGFWTKVLSAQEMADLYNSGNGNTMV